jgi:hypothetical protein
MCALAPEKDGRARMKSLGLYRQMESVYRRRAMVDETNREQWMAESKKWRERSEQEIRSHFRACNEAAPETTEH